MMTPVVIRFFPGILHKMANSKWVSKVSGVFFFGMTELPSSSATFLELTDRVTMTSSNGANNMGAPPGSAAAMVQHGGQVLLNWKPVISATAKGLVTWLTNLLFLLGIFDWFFCTETCWWFSLFCLDRLLLKKKPFGYESIVIVSHYDNFIATVFAVTHLSGDHHCGGFPQSTGTVAYWREFDSQGQRNQPFSTIAIPTIPLKLTKTRLLRLQWSNNSYFTSSSIPLKEFK